MNWKNIEETGRESEINWKRKSENNKYIGRKEKRKICKRDLKNKHRKEVIKVKWMNWEC